MRSGRTQTAELAQAEARLPRWMAAWALVGAIGVLLAGQARLAAGFGAGALVAILNYLWLHQAIESLLGASRPRVPRTLVAKLLIRYPLALGGVYLSYRSGWLPFVAVLAGLFVPVGGVLTEAVLQIRDGLRKGE